MSKRLVYPKQDPRGRKPYYIPPSKLEEAAIYDLIFNDASLRQVADRIDTSHQGVYMRAVAVLKFWARHRAFSLRSRYVNRMFKEE